MRIRHCFYIYLAMELHVHLPLEQEYMIFKQTINPWIDPMRARVGMGQRFIQKYVLLEKVHPLVHTSFITSATAENDVEQGR